MDPLFDYDEDIVSSLPYAACYCEENIYKLCEIIQSKCNKSSDRSIQTDNVYVVFLSCAIADDGFPLWYQKASNDKSHDNFGVVVWDYHVILLYDTLVYDIDSVLPYPCSLSEYVTKAIRPEMEPFDAKAMLTSSHKRRLKVVKLKDYLLYFSSDRSHMLHSRAKAPTWALIRGDKATTHMELPHYIDMSNTYGNATVYSVSEFVACYLSETNTP